MGCYDIVHVRCIKCQKFVDFQSKAGECSLNEYYLDNAPIAILDDINNRKGECGNCGSTFRIKVQFITRAEVILE